MAAPLARSLLSRFTRLLAEYEVKLLDCLTESSSNGLTPALAGVQVWPGHGHNLQEEDSRSGETTLDSLMKDPILWAVPKTRVPLERRKTRKWGESRMRPAQPKTNLVPCPRCGNWHERSTLCGKCYEKVMEETRAMQESMDPAARHHYAPQQEVVFLYEGEEKAPEFDGKYVVEVKKARPEWFPKKLLSKGHGRYDS